MRPKTMIIITLSYLIGIFSEIGVGIFGGYLLIKNSPL
jgi:hypothetical protein